MPNPTTSTFAFPKAQGADRTLHAALWFVLATSAYALIFNYWQLEPVPTDVYWAAVLVFATCLAPLTHWIASDRAQAPMVEFICIAYALQFSTPVFTQPNSVLILSQNHELAWSTVLEVLLFVEVGLCALLIGYYVSRHSPIFRVLPRINLPLTPRQRTSYFRFGFLVGGGLLCLDTLGLSPLSGNPVFGAISLLLTNQFTLAMILLAYDVFNTPSTKDKKTILLWVIVGVGFVTGLISGLLENALIPFALLIMVRWQATRKVPWTWIFLGIVAFAILNPAKAEYRQLVWYSDGGGGLFDKIGVWRDAVSKNISGVTSSGDSGAFEKQLRQPFSRLDLLHKFVWVRSLTPANVPYYQGKTYSYLLVAWIPRVLWPGKPTASAANSSFDLDYGLRLESQSSTTIAIGQLPEAYANFGLLGIILVMFVQGIVFAALNTMLNSNESDGGRAIYLTQMIYFLNGIGSSTVILFGALLQYVLASAFILGYFSRRKVMYASWREARKAVYLQGRTKDNTARSSQRKLPLRQSQKYNRGPIG